MVIYNSEETMKNEEKSLAREKCLLQGVDQLGQGSKLLWIVFVVNLFTLQLFGLNSMSYVFIAEIPEFRCSIPELSDANWTADQINEISIVDTCQQYDHNYTHLANLGYEKALQFVKEFEFLPNIVSCSSFTFDENERSTIVDEWELVCEKKLYRANTFLVYSLGITCGSGILGMYADKYGRKKSLVISIILQVIAGPASALVPWFWAYIICRFLTGMSTGAMYSSAFTILSEIAKDKRRKVFAAVIDSTFSVGIFFLIGIAHFLTSWRQVQWGISCFLIPIILLIWFIPESPRWLISQNRYDEAQKIIEKYNKSFVMTLSPNVENQTNESKLSSSNSPITPKKEGSFFKRNFGSLGILFTTSEFRRKILFMYFSYYVTTAVSLALVFNVDNFKSDRYIYMSIVALNEIIAHMTILVILMFVSSRKLLVIIYLIGSTLTMSILAASEENKTLIMGLALAARYCTSASFTVNLVLNSELFPSSVRNTALGTCVVAGQIGSLTAPYIVDILGSIAFWGPTTLCSILLLSAGLFCLTLPRPKFQEKSEFSEKEEVSKS